MDTSNENKGDSQSKNRIYFDGFDSNETKERILSIFSDYGSITNFSLYIKEQRFLGKGWIEFESSESVDKAIEAVSGMIDRGNSVSVEKYRPREERAKNVIVKNFGDAISDENQLKNLFKEFGKIVSAKVERDSNGKSRGFGYVNFERSEDASRAVKEKNGFPLKLTRPMQVIVCESKPKIDQKSSKNCFVGPMRAAKVDTNLLTNRAASTTNVHSKQKNLENATFKKLQVKNFGGEIKEDHQLRSYFEKFGEIKYATVVKDKNGVSLGCGYVCFAKHDDAERALKAMHNFPIPYSKQLKVEIHNNKAERERKELKEKINPLTAKSEHLAFEPSKDCPESGQPSSKAQTSFTNIYVKKFEDTIQSDDQLENIFAKFGEIISAKVMKDDFNKSKGFGFVCFKNASDAKAAVEQMHGQIVNGKKLYVAKSLKKTERERQLKLRNQFLAQVRKKKIYKPTVDSGTYCPACCTNWLHKDIVNLKCGHVICKECMNIYIQTSVKERKIKSILCPECEVDVDYDLIKNSVPKKLFTSYDEMIFKVYMENAEDISNCEYQAFFVKEVLCETAAVCGYCEYKFCITCREDFHGTSSCGEIESKRNEIIRKYRNGTKVEKADLERRYTKKKLEHLLEDYLNKECINAICKRCPSCGVSIQKNGGCKHMCCFKCGKHFCWQCYADLNPNDLAAHYDKNLCVYFTEEELLKFY
ncbi:polyadenylate-binding protein 7-like protein [Dinothrombium tinctorium]|uniref:Polyadenylate-binding protein 7-like protein n=1 Tax=Dinothrombium tinctorium TaxID=1965070 RepID=A0A3S3P5U1_9ACAR|nr:polyadenylate-binding protein 7-like protein [Dinothrombium tinctorium]RWS05826.1 polyadenylate-binding protein 7-like protein [Dinothrombium tinctorium]